MTSDQAEIRLAVPDLTLEAVLGPALAPIPLTSGSSVTLGRLPECEVQLPESEKTVSRKHCIFEARLDPRPAWYLTDIGSRHGTFLNNAQLPPHVARELKSGDTIRVGPWVFRLAPRDGRAQGMVTVDDKDSVGTANGQGKLVTVTHVDQFSIDRRRLELLIQCAKNIQSCADEHQLAACVVDALLEGTGYPRIAIVRPASDSVQTLAVLASKTAASSTATFQFSRSLVAAACSGQMVQLRFDDAAMAMPAMSIMSVGMTTAMAVPVFLDKSVSMCFYLDARQDERPVHDDAAAFCQAIAEMSSLSLANMQRTRMHVERLRMAEQMEAASQIQRQILPPTAGSFGTVAYAMELRAGRFVAGDLFDFIRLDDRRIAFFLGDVAGKGVPAAILMATTQSFLNAALAANPDDPADAVRLVNTHLVQHSPEGKFVSLWVGVLDMITGRLRFCDAGHGYAMVVSPGAPPREIQATIGKSMPLRVLEDAEFRAEDMTLAPGSRIVLFSDGVVEQTGSTDGSGEQPFGLERVSSTLAASASAQDDVQLLVRAVVRHAASESLADDLTVASIELRSLG